DAGPGWPGIFTPLPRGPTLRPDAGHRRHRRARLVAGRSGRPGSGHQTLRPRPADRRRRLARSAWIDAFLVLLRDIQPAAARAVASVSGSRTTKRDPPSAGNSAWML